MKRKRKIQGKRSSLGYTTSHKKRKFRKAAVAITILTAVAVFVISPYSRYALSLSVMSVYSKICEQESILKEKGMELEIPGGCEAEKPDWYPFVMTFNPGQSAIENYLGEKGSRLTILYNFPAFDLRWGKGCSRLYDDTSPYYDGFYGAYILSSDDESQQEKRSEKAVSAVSGKTVTIEPVDRQEMPVNHVTGNEHVKEDEQKKEGSDAELDQQRLIKLIGKITQFDYQRLVIGDFPIDSDQEIFQWKIQQIKKKTSVAGSDGWLRIDADMLVNGALHQRKSFVRSYLQYGSPKYDVMTDFAPVEMKGRVYAKYLEEQDVTVFFYVLARTDEVLENCDRTMLQTAHLR